MRPLIFVDMDDTLFQTARKCPPGERECVAVDKAGEPASFMMPQQRAFFEWIGANAALVPCTGRNVAAYERIQLPGFTRAICSFGGVIREASGEPNAPWHETIAVESEREAEHLAAFRQRALEEAAIAGVDARARVIEDAGLPLYVSIKHNAEDIGDLSSLLPSVRAFLPAAWTIHANANNMALLPPFLSKARAARWYLENLAEQPVPFTLGVGDSLSDLNYMSACHYAVTPTSSQLFRAMMEAAHP